MNRKTIAHEWQGIMTESNDVNTAASGMPGEMSTKERILDAAIDLFAKKGFDAVAMREISEASGVKKATLYYYFTSKDEILEKIFEHVLMSWKRSQLGKWSENIEAEEQIVSMGLDGFMAMASDVFTRWIDDPRMEKIMRIVFIELYHNEQLKKSQFAFMDAGATFFESSFAILMKHKLIKLADPKVLAVEYLSFYMLAFMDYFIIRYGSISRSFLQEYRTGIDEHTAFMTNAIRP
jgi:AcrR family transcriptional regulator